MNQRGTLRCAALILAVTVPTFPAHAQTTEEERASRFYENGLKNFAQRQYDEGLNDLRRVIDDFPRSSKADDALLAIARYHLDVQNDSEAAEKIVAEITRNYATGDAVAEAQVLLGRIGLSRWRTAADIATAIQQLERVPVVYAGTPAVPGALFYLGEARRLERRNQEALDAYRRIAGAYPRAAWTARALLGAARCLTALGAPFEAMQELQRVRDAFPGTPEAQRALEWNTLLFRLYTEAPSPYSLPPKPLGGGRLRDVIMLAFTRRGHLMALSEQSVFVLHPEEGTVISNAAVRDVRVVIDQPNGTLMTIQQSRAIYEKGLNVQLGVPRGNGELRPLDNVPSAVRTASGDLLVVDRSAKNISRFTGEGEFLAPFAAVPADSLVINNIDDVAALDRGGRRVSVLKHDGQLVFTLGGKGAARVAFDNPVAVSWDPLGHLYVLDRGLGVLYVFTPAGALLKTFEGPERNAPGSLRRAGALAVDNAGRVFVDDDRTASVQVFR
jgi:TolA-binding protein